MQSLQHSNKNSLKVLYQDRTLAVIVKPCGMLSVPNPSSPARGTVVGVMEEMMRKKGTYSYARRPLAVHRLDRDTSGVMMMALGEKWRRVIMDSWHNMVTERLYRAVVEMPHGAAAACILLRQDNGVIDLPLAFDKGGRTYVPKRNQNIASVTARTHYKVLSRGKKYMLLELSLDTGRKNQIRSHLAAVGCPVAGDAWRGAHTNPYGRLALHARTLSFTHPQTGEAMHFEVPESGKWLMDCSL